MEIPGLTGAYAHSLQSLEEMLLQSILGNTPLAPFVPTIASMGNSMLGLQNDVLLNSVLFTNMTPYGAYNSQMERAINQAAGSALRLQRSNAQLAWLRDIGRASMSYESWLKQNNYRASDERHAQYENWISNQAYSRNDSMFWNAAYSLLDPDGLAGASEYLGAAASNVMRHSARRGNRGIWRQAKAIRDIFNTGENGAYEYNKFDYGHMSARDTAAVMAALTKEIDFFEGIDGTSTKKISEATKKLRDMTKEFTKALGPLKDIFGSDVPAMITTIEGLTGKKFASLDPTKITGVVNRAVAGMQSGIFDKNVLLATSAEISSNMLGMKVSSINDLSAGSQAMGILSRVQGGLRPIGMSEARYVKWVGDSMLRSSVSSGAEAFNQAYAVWKNDWENRGKSIAEFAALYEKMRTDPNNKRDADEALLALSGTHSFAELRQKAYGSAALEEAYTNNYGGIAAMWENAQRAIDMGRDLTEDLDAYNQAVDFLTDNPLIGQNQTEREKYLRKKLKGKSGDMIARVNSEILRISQGYYDQGDIRVGASITAAVSAKKSQRDLDRQIRIREKMNTLKEGYAANGTDLIRDILKNPDKIRDSIGKYGWFSAADPDVQRSILFDIQDTVTRFADNNIRPGSKEAQAKLDEAMQYAIYNAPMNSYRMDLFDERDKLLQEYQDAVDKYGNEDHAEVTQIQAQIQDKEQMIHLAKYVDSSVLEKLGQEKSLAFLELINNRRDMKDGKPIKVSEDDYRTEFRDMMIADEFRSRIEDSNLNDNSKKLLISSMDEKASRVTDDGKQTSIVAGDIKDVIKYAEKHGKDLDPKAREEVNRIFNDIIYNDKNLDTDQLLRDNLLTQKNLLTKLEQYLDIDEKLKEKGLHEAEDADYEAYQDPVGITERQNRRIFPY